MHKMFVSHVILQNIALTVHKSLTDIHILLVKILRKSYVKLKHFLLITKVWSKYYVELTLNKNVFFDNQIWSSCICTCETKIEIGIAVHEMFVSHVVVQKLSLTACKILTEIHILLVRILREIYVKLKHFLW